MTNHLLYINDNYFQIKTKEIKLIESSSIQDGEIINREQFIKDYKNNIKDKKIISNGIKILLNKEIKEKDLLYYSSIFEELNYSKILIESTNKYLENDILIPNQNIYIIYHNNCYYYLYPFLLEAFIKNENIIKLKILSNIKLKNNNYCKYYYYANNENYFIK